MTDIQNDFLPEDGESRPPFSPIVRFVERGLIVAGGVVLFLMMAMTTVDVFGRYFFNAPLGFAYELTQMGMALVVFCALPSVTLRSEHVTVGIFEGFLKGRVKAFRDLLIAVFIMVSSLFLGWRLFLLTQRFLNYGDKTSVLGLPVGVFAGLATTAFILAGAAAFILVMRAVAALSRGQSK